MHRLETLDSKFFAQAVKGRKLAACDRDARLRDYSKALQTCRDAIAVDDSVAWPHASLGWALLASQRADEGIAECEKAVRLDEKNVAGWNNLA